MKCSATGTEGSKTGRQYKETAEDVVEARSGGLLDCGIGGGLVEAGTGGGGDALLEKFFNSAFPRSINPSKECLNGIKDTADTLLGGMLG